MSLELEKNKDQNKLLLSELNQRIAAIKLKNHPLNYIERR